MRFFCLKKRKKRISNRMPWSKLKAAKTGGSGTWKEKEKSQRTWQKCLKEERKWEGKKERKEVRAGGFADGKFSFSDGACVWCMWLSDSGSGFGKIVKRQTDLQKKCQKGLHNDTTQSWEASIYADCKQICLVIGNEMATFCDYSKDINFIS